MVKAADEMARGKRVWMDEGEWCALERAGVVAWNEHNDERVLTDAGRELAKVGAAKRAKRNAASRGRSEALSSVGMRRTASGWE